MAENYTLTTCDALTHQTITNLCWDSRHPLEGKVVYIDQVYNGFVVSPSTTYTLTYDGQNVDVCNGWLPRIKQTTEDACSPSYFIGKFQNCETGAFRSFGFTAADPTDDVIRLDGDCDCWKYVSEDTIADELTTAYTGYLDCTECLETRGEEICPSGERSLSYAVVAGLPTNTPPDRGFAQCCYTQLALASISDSSEYKNDETGVYFKRDVPNSTVVFKLVDAITTTEYLLNDATYGEFQDFGGVQADLTYFVVSWRKVLTLLGAGSYQIKQEITVAGLSDEFYSNTFTLRTFSIDNADKTVRIDCQQDGLLVRPNVDFKGTTFRTMLRLNGFFGRAERSFTVDRLFKRDYDSQQITTSIDTDYKFQALKIPACISDELFDFVLLGNRVTISDYNKNNHSYNYELKEVALENNDGTEYFTLDRGVNVNLTFSDRFKNNRKTNC